MFKRFYEAKAAKPVDEYILRDSHTNVELMRGTLERCTAFKNAFGVSYIVKAS